MAESSTALIRACRKLSRDVATLSFGRPVDAVYNPLEYAWEMHRTYLTQYGAGTRSHLWLGMNPGPWGMAQTGIPFGEVAAVRDWLQLDEPVLKPSAEHPKRPVDGLACTRSEVSGRRLWGLMAERFGSAERFFQDHFVLNYCPLAFLAASGANITPDKLPVAETQPLYEMCDHFLRSAIRQLKPRCLIGIGGFAEQVLLRLAPAGCRVVRILHPSPASPAANRDWAGQVTRTLVDAGIW